MGIFSVVDSEHLCVEHYTCYVVDYLCNEMANGTTSSVTKLAHFNAVLTELARSPVVLCGISRCNMV